VNAMAVPLLGEPELVDPHGGAGDLEAGLLRVLHDRSFIDDPTRALRAARYAARYEFELEPTTAELLRAADLGTVSGDRIEAELRKLAEEPRARQGFELLEVWGLITLAPGAAQLVDTVSELASAPPWNGLVRRGDAVLAAAHGRGLDSARELATTQPESPSRAVEQARGRGPVTLVLARALGAEWLDRYAREWRHVRLEINGDDLLAAEVPEGPAIGHGLTAAMRAKLDGEVSGRDEELRIALKAARA
jgi:tRNA nucleotidyltransferase (CCA-adding enzyme)